MFFCNFCNCLPEKPLKTTDLIQRWFIIARDRFERELCIEKLLRVVRNVKSLVDPDESRKMFLERQNLIEIDTDDLMAPELQF